MAAMRINKKRPRVASDAVAVRRLVQSNGVQAHCENQRHQLCRWEKVWWGACSKSWACASFLDICFVQASESLSRESELRQV